MPNQPHAGQHTSRRPSSGRYRSPASRPPPIELPGKKQNIRSLIHFFNWQASFGIKTPANHQLAPTTVQIPKNVVRARITTFNRLETFSAPATILPSNNPAYQRSRSFPEPRRATEGPRNIDEIVSGNVHHHRQKPDRAQYKITVSGGDKRETTYSSIKPLFNPVRVWNEHSRRQNSSSSSVQHKDGVIGGPPDLSVPPKIKHKHRKHKASPKNTIRDLSLPNKNASVGSVVAKPRKRKKSAVMAAQRVHRNEGYMLDGKQSTTEELSQSTGSLKGTLLSMFREQHGGGEGSGAAGVEAPMGTVRGRMEQTERTCSSECTGMVKSPGKETETHQTRHEFSKTTLRKSICRESQLSKAKVEDVTGDPDIQHELRTPRRTRPFFFKDVAQKRREDRKKAALALSTSDEHVSVPPLWVVKATGPLLPQQVQHTRASDMPRAALPEDIKHMHDPSIHGFMMPKMDGPYRMGSMDTLTPFEEPLISHVESSEKSGSDDVEIPSDRSRSPEFIRREPVRSPSPPFPSPLERTYTPLRSSSLMREMALPKLRMCQSRRSRPAADRKPTPVMTRPWASTVSLERGIPRMKLKKDIDWCSSWRNRKANLDSGKDSRIGLNKAHHMSASSSSSHDTTASSEIYRYTGSLLQSQMHVHLTQSKNLGVDSSGVGELEDDTEWDDRSPGDVAVTSSSGLDSGDADERPTDEIPKTTFTTHRRSSILRGPWLNVPKPLLSAPAATSKRTHLQERQISFDGSVDSSPLYPYSNSDSPVLDRANVLDGGGEELDEDEEGTTSDATFEDARECRKSEIRARLDEQRWGHGVERPRKKKGKQGRIGIADCQFL